MTRFDFNTLLTSIKAIKPDAIFFGGYDAKLTDGSANAVTGT
jgi:hypothetical protein